MTLLADQQAGLPILDEELTIRDNLFAPCDVIIVTAVTHREGVTMSNTSERFIPRGHRGSVAPSDIRVVESAEGHEVHIRGRLDVHSVPDVRDAVHAVIDAGGGHVFLYLADAEIGDSTGLGLLLHVYRRATRCDRRLRVMEATERTTRLLRGCRLSRLLSSHHGDGSHESGREIRGPLGVAPLTA